MLPTALAYRQHSLPLGGLHSIQVGHLLLHQWSLLQGEPLAEVLVLHGYMEHGGRYEELAQALGQRRIATWAVDLRGHGRSSGRRGYVEHYADYMEDAQAAFAALPPTRPRFILGHSNGGLIALQFGLSGAAGVQGVCVTNPFLQLTTAAPWHKRVVGNLCGKLLPAVSLPAGLHSADLTRDATKAVQHSQDPYIFRSANAAWFREVQLAQQALRTQQAFGLPLLFIYSDADPVASPAACEQLAAQLVCADKTVLVRPEERHEVLNELGRAELYEQIADWLLKRC